MKRAIVVLTENRTASQSVYAALKPFEAAPDLIVRHSHGLDDRAWRGVGPTPEKAARFARKDEKEAEIRKILFDEAVDRTIVTIARDPLDRLISDLWYSRHEEISAHYFGVVYGKARFQIGLLDALRKPIGWIVAKSLARYYEVWKPLGLPEIASERGPQVHHVNGHLRRCTLRFNRINADFDNLLRALSAADVLPTTAMDLGSLPHKNAGDNFGAPAIHAGFTEWGRANLAGVFDHRAAPAGWPSRRLLRAGDLVGSVGLR